MSTEKSPDWQPNNENRPPNMRVKNKVLGVPNIAKPTTSRSKEAKVLTKSVSSRSLMRASWRADDREKTVSVLDTERNMVGKLLEEGFNESTFMPEEVRREDGLAKMEATRNQIEAVIELKEKTAKHDGLVELVGGDVSRVNFDCYLRALGELEQTRTLRMIRSGLVDADMDSVLKLLAVHPGVETLILTNNKLTELSVAALRAFKQRHPESRLEQVYLGNNFIRHHKATQFVRGLEKNGLAVHL